MILGHFKRYKAKFVITKRSMMAAAVGMVSRRTKTSPCWDDEVDARNAEASVSGGERIGVLQV